MKKKNSQTQLYTSIWKRKAKKADSGLSLRHIAGADLVSSGKRLLDVGCGVGLLAEIVKDKYKEIHGLELSATAIGLAKEKGVIAAEIDFNYDDFPYEDNFFDTVACLDMIEHIFDPRTLLKKCFRVLKENGFPIVVKSDAIVYPDTG